MYTHAVALELFTQCDLISSWIINNLAYYVNFLPRILIYFN